jgi:TrmH RNA methyltransferase
MNSSYRSKPPSKIDLKGKISKKSSQRRNTKQTTNLKSSPVRAPIKFYGYHACLKIFERRRGDIRRVFYDPKLEPSLGEVISWCERAKVLCKSVRNPEELSRIAATDHHEGLCIEALPIAWLKLDNLLKGLKSSDAKGSPRVVVILEGVDNPHNVGAIIRTSSFFGVEALIVISEGLRTLSGALCRVAEGGVESLPIAFAARGEGVSSVVEGLQRIGYSVVATTPHKRGEVIWGRSWGERVAILFGAEGGGLSEAGLTSADSLIRIPGSGDIESLNVSAAVAVVLGAVCGGRY